MRLLSKQEIKTTKDNQAVYVQRLSDVVFEETRKINLLKDEYEQEKARITEDTEIFAKENKEKKKILENEVASLEARKKAALEPLDQQKQLLNKKEEELMTAIADVKKKEQVLLLKEDKLDKKEFELVERIKGIIKTQETADKSMAYIATQLEVLNNKENELNNREAGLNSWLTKAEEDYTESKRLINEERNHLKVIKKELDKQAKEQKDKDRQILDKYNTLQRTIERYATR